MPRRVPLAAIALLLLSSGARAEPVTRRTPITYVRALTLARRDSLDLAAVRGREAVVGAEVRVAGTHPNPTLFAGTSTQAAKLSAGVSMPLLILGQLGAAADASRADVATAKVDTEVAWNDVRAGAARAFIALWLSEKFAVARGDAAVIAARLDDAVKARVEVGAAPELEGLRAHAERLRADADAREAVELVAAAGSDLGRWLGVTDGGALRAEGDPDVPVVPPSLAELSSLVRKSPAVRREEADARAADARANHERALSRPLLTLDLGLDAADPTLPATNYRAQLGIEVPLVNQRGAHVDRELYAAAAARSRGRAEQHRVGADLDAAYRRFVAVSARTTALAEGVVPSAEAAANATEEAYTMGRAALVAVLDAERARLDARVGLIEARAARASAWVEVEYAVGAP